MSMSAATPEDFLVPGRRVDRDRVEQAHAQPATSFDTIFLPLLIDCRAFALALTRNLHDAEDLVADTYVKAFKAFDRFQIGTQPKAWMFTIMRRLHIDHYRRARHRPANRPEDELIEMSSESAKALAAPLPPEAFERDASHQFVLAAIEGIPQPFRECVQLRDLHGFSYREVGEILGIPPGTVMSRLYRGREYVRQALVSQEDGSEHADTEGDT